MLFTPCIPPAPALMCYQRCGQLRMDTRRAPEFTVAPDPDDQRLARTVIGIDQDGREAEQRVVTERPLTIFLNGQEIVTAMTIGEHPQWIAGGYLLNQG